MPSSTVLVVDDDYLLRHVLAEALRLEGYDVIQAGDGRTAVGLVRQARPAALILNYSIPQMTGREVIMQLREEDIDVPILLISGAPRPLDLVPPGSFLAKPFDLLAMLDWVKAAIHNSNGHGPR